MTLYLQLLASQLAMLLTVGAIGAWPATLLKPAEAGWSRLALAPAFGVALGAAITTNAVYFMPMKIAAWIVLLPLALGSCFLAFRRLKKNEELSLPSRSDLCQIVLIVAAVSATFSSVLVMKGSYGPILYHVGDANGYVANIQGYERHPIKDAEKFRNVIPKLAELSPSQSDQRQRAIKDAKNIERGSNASDIKWAGMAAGYQQVGVDSLSAGVNVITQQKAVNTQSSYMITLLMVIALGVFSAVRSFTQRRTLIALFSAILICGPFSFQLFIDGSQSALAGIALITPSALTAYILIRQPDWRVFALVAVLIAGALAAYPVVLGAFFALFGLAVLITAVKTVRPRLADNWNMNIRQLTVRLFGAALLTLALAPVPIERFIRYWQNLLSKFPVNPGLPSYDLPVQVLPSWLLQTREFYNLPRITDTSLEHWLRADLIPFVLICVIVYGLYRNRRGLIFLPVIAAAAFAAYQVVKQKECSYCEQRNLLIIAPCLVVLLGVGISEIQKSKDRLIKYGATAASLIILVVTLHQSSATASRAYYGAYAPPKQAYDMYKQISSLDEGSIFLESNGETGSNSAEEPALYYGVDAYTDRRLSINTEEDSLNGLPYLGGKRPVGLEFDPDYRWIFTRAGGIKTNRRTVSRSGPFAVQERADSPDVLIVDGIALDPVFADTKGTAWVNGQLVFWVVGQHKKPMTLRLGFKGPSVKKAKLLRPKASATSHRRGKNFTVCVKLPANSAGALQRVYLAVDFPVKQFIPPVQKFPTPYIGNKGLNLDSMYLRSDPCS